jgi:hypothetical protein
VCQEEVNVTLLGSTVATAHSSVSLYSHSAVYRVLILKFTFFNVSNKYPPNISNGNYIPILDLLRINPSKAELNPICHLLALVEAHHILHVSRIRVTTEMHNCWFDSHSEASQHGNDIFRNTVFYFNL